MGDMGYSGTTPLPNSFYLPLLSDSSGAVFPDNTLTHFRVQLETPLYFAQDDWECGLAEIMWPSSEMPVKKRVRRDDDDYLSNIFSSGPAPTTAHNPPSSTTLLGTAAADEVSTGWLPATRAPTTEGDVPPAAEDGTTATPTFDATPPPREPIRSGPEEAGASEEGQVIASAGEGLQPPLQAAQPAEDAEAASPQPPLSVVPTADQQLTATKGKHGQDPLPGTQEEEEEDVSIVLLGEAPKPPPPAGADLLFPGVWDDPFFTRPQQRNVTEASSMPVPNGARAFIYIDIIRPSLCSDFRGKCLRIVPVDHGVMHHPLFPVYYFPVEKRVVDVVYVEVKDKFNKYLAFEASATPLVLVLHFKRSAVSP